MGLVRKAKTGKQKQKTEHDQNPNQPCSGFCCVGGVFKFLLLVVPCSGPATRTTTANARREIRQDRRTFATFLVQGCCCRRCCPTAAAAANPEKRAAAEAAARAAATKQTRNKPRRRHLVARALSSSGTNQKTWDEPQWIVAQRLLSALTIPRSI